MVFMYCWLDTQIMIPPSSYKGQVSVQWIQTIEHVSYCIHYNHPTVNLAIYSHEASQDKLPEA